MAVADQDPRNSYIANGVTTTFAYTFKIFEDSDLLVEVDGVIKTLTTDYTVTGAGASGGGNVVFVSAPANGAEAVIYRDLPYTRETDYSEDLLSNTLNDDIDRTVMLIQQDRCDRYRALKVPMSETGDQVIDDATTRAGGVLGFDDTTGAIETKFAADMGLTEIGDGLKLTGSTLSIDNPDIVAKTSNYNIVATDCYGNKVFQNEGATSLIEFALPSAVVGMKVSFAVVDTDGLKIIAATGETIRFAGAITATAGSIQSVNIGDAITLVCLEAGKWTVENSVKENYGTISGADTYTMTIPFLPALYDGLLVRGKVINANTATAPTLNPNSIGAKKVFKEGGLALSAGDIPTGHHALFSYDTTLDTDSGGWLILNPKSSASVIASYENLAVGNNGTNPNYQLDITADKIQFTNGMVVSSFSKTVDITASGANGLDTGSEAGTAWYHIWAIAKTDGTNASLLSLSATAPTMPSGYTLKTYLGAVFNNASSNFLSMKQTNKSVAREISNALSAGTATASTAVDLTTFIPSTAKKVRGNASHSIASMRWFIISPTNSNTGRLWWRGYAVDSQGVGSPFVCPIMIAQTIYYCVEPAGNCTIEVSGWEF